MTDDLSRNAVIARIKAALKRRSGKTWSVTGGRGTDWGWIRIAAPPARCTWRALPAGRDTYTGQGTYTYENTGRPGHEMSPADRLELQALLSLDRPLHGSESIPASSAYYQEYLDRAEGRTPSVIATPYWD